MQRRTPSGIKRERERERRDREREREREREKKDREIERERGPLNLTYRCRGGGKREAANHEIVRGLQRE